ncbi:XK-related protein 5 [Oxyura jamaicensis]|uniref:XK-related protein 5 n=1 Tax=Oxyura jamaicensis TaxID=8884 RepID=UPI0015A6BDF5|nr:XK-related protein 5 [Oxyura jamaicensis]
MRGGFPGLSLALLAAESAARLSTIIHYLARGQLVCFWLTVACLAPGCVPQLLSILWFRADGRPPGRGLLVLHVLQLGLWKRYWDVLRLEAKAGGSASAGEVLLQLGDVCVLRLLEALLQTLPHLLLQAYVVVAVEPSGLVPGVSAGLSLLSLSWALVSYSRFSCLLKPGHVRLPAAALLCLLLWRTGMLGTRVLALVLFTRLYSCWVLAVAGIHWLLMAFWLVAQQTDIVAQPCRWRLFNALVGAVYVFCYVNVQPGASRHRVAVFYLVMLVENTLLLLLATEFLQAETRHSLGVTGAILSGSAVGAAALVVYYSLLHPKSTEIWEGFLEKSCRAVTAGDDQDAGNSSQTGQSLGISGDGETLEVEGTTVASKKGNGSSLLHVGGCLEDAWTNHHHWLLVRLALKTGDVSQINAAFGDGGVGEVYTGKARPGAELCLPTREITPVPLGSDLTNVKLVVMRNGGGSKDEVGGEAAHEDRAGQQPASRPATSLPSTSPPALDEISSVYFSANAGGITSAGVVTAMATSSALVQGDNEAQAPPGCLAGGGGREEDSSLGMANISPILGSCAHRHLQSSSSLCRTSDCGAAGPPGTPVGWHHLQDTQQGTVPRSKLRPPCFTSTPKADPKACCQAAVVLHGKEIASPPGASPASGEPQQLEQLKSLGLGIY